MPLEVELKFRVDDPQGFRQRLAALAPQAGKTVTEVDQYFNHPARDFARTDEAVRIRSIGEQNQLTYKGPKLDQATKTRRELEIDFVAGADESHRMGELLVALGFRPVATVRKQRDYATVQWQARAVTVLIDDVERAGRFVELEIIAEEADLDAARDCVLSLARELGLEASERRSYLEMVLASSQLAPGQ